MYLPEVFHPTDPDLARELIDGHPFATVITWPGAASAQARAQIPMLSHLPILLDETNPAKPLLIGHLARANPQSSDFEEGREALVVFHGPHAYVSPRWYENKSNVPTWNYAVVHVHGKSRPVSGQRLREILDRSVTKFEAEIKNGQPWRFSGNPDLPESFGNRLMDRLMETILGFEIEMTTVEAKFKLSQNRDPADRLGAMRGLREAGGEMSQALLALMERNRT